MPQQGGSPHELGPGPQISGGRCNAPASNLTGLPAIIPAPELQTTTFPPVSWIVEGLLPEGITLFAGKPKLGKSWLALQIGYGIASGSEVLGRPAEQGSVLYAALEDNNRRLKHRMCKIAPYTDDLAGAPSLRDRMAASR
jgi:hypothetical protein